MNVKFLLVNALVVLALGARGEMATLPVGVAIDRQGALLVADDAGNVVWRVTAAEPRGRQR